MNETNKQTTTEAFAEINPIVCNVHAQFTFGIIFIENKEFYSRLVCSTNFIVYAHIHTYTVINFSASRQQINFYGLNIFWRQSVK